MTEKETEIKKYIDDKKELQKLILQIIDESETDDETNLHNLLNFLKTHQYDKNKHELKLFLHLISVLSNNHRRVPAFFDKIEKILTISSQLYKPIFSNEELFKIFQENKPILLFLLKSKIIIIDEIIFKHLMTFTTEKDDKINYYFYPELDSIIKSKAIDRINEENYNLKLNEDIEKFESNRQKNENESKLCSMIRDDLIDEFIPYINANSISLKSHVGQSLFETNSMLSQKVPTIIEYAFFFGSIQIIKYLNMNKVDLKPSLWLYAVHSDNPEVIQFLEEKKIEIDDRTFSEAIKCHHNDIARYIYENYLDNPMSISNLSDEDVISIYSSENFEFFTNEIDGNKIFFNLVQNEYYEIVDLYLTTKMNEINDYISQNGYVGDDLIKIALRENKLDVAYKLLKDFSSTPQRFYEEEQNITKLALPPSISEIQPYSFAKFSSLEYITIPSTVTSIGQKAFKGCSSLKQITIPSSVTSIGRKAFKGCSSLKTIIIPSSITIIDSYTFEGCSSLTHIDIPSSVREIKDNVFCDCLSLKQIDVPPTLTYLGSCSFYNCQSLNHFTLPKSIDSIEGNLFYSCVSLKEFIIPHSVTSIKGCAFSCSGIKKLTIPSSVKSIGNYAFLGCDQLTEISIPPSVTEIGEYAFNCCSSLKKIEIPPPVSFIGDYTFYNCYSLTEISFPKTLMRIAITALDGCSSLEKLTIPSRINPNIFRCPSGYEVIKI